MDDFKLEEQPVGRDVKIKIIGCGGAGCNMVNHMIAEYNLDERVDMIVANTDAQDISKSLAKSKITIGTKKTKGLGAGMKPEVGRAAAEESKEELIAALDKTDIVYIAAGLGGGTGTGAAPIVANAAKASGALVVSVVTTPFRFEGAERNRIAQAGLEELKKESDGVIVIHNQKLTSFLPKNVTMRDAYKTVDEVLSRAVRGMVTMLLDEGYVNVDFKDVQTTFEHKGLALIGTGRASGDNALSQAFELAIESPLLDSDSIEGALGFIVYVKSHQDKLGLFEFEAAMEDIQTKLSKKVRLIYGNSFDDSMGDEIEVIVLATGFDAEAKKQELKEEAKAEAQKPQAPVMTLKKAVGGYENLDDIDFDTPSYKRYQLD